MDDRKKVDIADVARGCMFGGAIGDALGYPVEFFSYERIKAAYGEGGITSLRLTDGKALVSDDTQMTLFTVEALALFACGRGSIEECGAAAYADWLATQRKGRPVPGNTPLAERAAMYVCRAPGNTCLSALESGVTGTVDKPINGSKGCGGVMRVAPCGVAAKLLGGANGAAVNHSGDSDSTGAIAGNILGAFRGMGAWDAEDVDALDLKEEIGMKAKKLAEISA